MQKTIALFSSAALMSFAFSANAAVTGKIKFAGKSSDAAIDMKSDPKCQKLSPGAKSDEIVASGGGLADTFVYVAKVPAGKYKAKAEVTIDQVGCKYSPKVSGVMVKQDFTIKNSDPTLHNIHAFAKRGEFNVGMPTQGQTIKKQFKKEEVLVSIKCDVHPWMQAWVGVLEHPFYAVSGADGSFNIDAAGLADGEYEIIAHHPKLGEKKGKAKIAGGNATVDFSF